MPLSYLTRSVRNTGYLTLVDDSDEPEALSSIAPSSSPPVEAIEVDDLPPEPFGTLPDFPEDDEGDLSYVPSHGLPARRRSDEEKAFAVLKFMRENLSRFSLRTFLMTLFSSNSGGIKNYVNTWKGNGGIPELLEVLWSMSGLRDEDVCSWVAERAAKICAREAGWLTDRAAEGPHTVYAERLRSPATTVSVAQLKSFRIEDLTAAYSKTMPRTRMIMKAIINKENTARDSESRNPDDGCTLATSILLNLRSQKSNVHQVINSMILWDNRAPKRLVQMLNRFGVSVSYDHLCTSILVLSANALRIARKIANDPRNMIMLPYDNFNWVSGVWETSVLHGAVQHDQVSAMVISLTLPESGTAHRLASVERFEACRGTRHRLPAQTALQDIVPSEADHTAFRDAAISHVMMILVDEVAGFAGFRASVPGLVDPDAIPVRKTDRHYLPTFDQEQGSTRGNMAVLKHYFIDVLQIPKAVFEDTMFFVLGDRLTTARDRAAQDQRGVDRSDFRADHLSSLAMTSGLMHVCFNFIQACAKNLWGGENRDTTSLQTLRDLLRNRSEINIQKFDFYAWLRFLDCVLRALVISAAVSTLVLKDTTELSSQRPTAAEFRTMCETIVDTYVMSSPDCLEADGIKSVKGNTTSGHAALTMFDLMTLREMRHAIKHGHPTRILRILKFWTPMFYAGRSYNYAHECMELLHNLIHDWPEDTAKVLLASMLVNTTGEPDGFLEADLDVEHLNLRIKNRAHGTNATPEMLCKVTPSLGHVRDLTDRVYKETGVRDVNEHHAKVQQHTDIRLLANHLVTSHALSFALDQVSEHAITDLFRTGLHQLAGPHGGHAKHLLRHRLRLRSRHADESHGDTHPENSVEDITEAENELANAEDTLDGAEVMLHTHSDNGPINGFEHAQENELVDLIRAGENGLRSGSPYNDYEA
ncbi:uncharacterized protein B0H18DRAFT_1207744 [Fomitopsis serialis]|uniref:uncharacterized protein n=1 Tax=Fomitopsis serialis TaxID=139415 RepID=UPI0020083E99|nr:uncharacterized protein B0H18DRAFT_1207744 [Neoantrodia serialis]KAH9934210.1 hypothetical protein B0H18DRAFT_1207744 [Neoantrodia serialis]